MKLLPLILSILVTVLLGLLWAPALAPQKDILSGAALAGSVLLAGTLVFALNRTEEPRKPGVSPVAAPAPGRVAPAPVAGGREGVEAIGLLSALQENGRLVDFLMDDITAYPDAQVGVAARIVHQGCRAVLDQCFAIIPACESAEGATISVPVSYRGDEYRLSGTLSGKPPFTGTVVHRGWKSPAVKLPRMVPPDRGIPNIAPTEVEVKA